MKNFLLLSLPALNALGFVLYTFVIGSSWMSGAIMGILTSSTVLLALYLFTNEKLALPPMSILPYMLGSAFCFFLAEIVKMNSLSFSQADKLSYIGLLSPLFVVGFMYLFGTVELNRWHITGGFIAMIGAAFVLYGGR